MTLSELAHIAKDNTLTWDQAKQAIDLMFSGHETTQIIINFLDTVNSRPILSDELAGYVQGIEHSAQFLLYANEFPLPLIDIAGTGGDGHSTINVSTLASIITAASDQVIVTKYGNRAATSKSGSMDVLEKLGITITLTEQQTIDQLNRLHYAPLFAQNIYPGAKHVAAARTALKPNPTLFNLAFPIARPITAGLNVLMGVSNPTHVELFTPIYTMAPGVNRVLLVNGHDGSDEISISGSGKSNYRLIQKGNSTTGTIDISNYHIDTAPLPLLSISDPQDSADWFIKILDPNYAPQESEVAKLKAMRDYVTINAAAALFTALDDSNQLEQKLPDYIDQTRTLLSSSQALNKLKSLKS